MAPIAESLFQGGFTQHVEDENLAHQQKLQELEEAKDGLSWFYGTLNSAAQALIERRRQQNPNLPIDMYWGVYERTHWDLTGILFEHIGIDGQLHIAHPVIEVWGDDDKYNAQFFALGGNNFEAEFPCKRLASGMVQVDWILKDGDTHEQHYSSDGETRWTVCWHSGTDDDDYLRKKTTEDIIYQYTGGASKSKDYGDGGILEAAEEEINALKTINSALKRAAGISEE